MFLKRLKTFMTLFIQLFSHYNEIGDRMKLINSNSKTTPLNDDPLSRFFNTFNICVNSVGIWSSEIEKRATYTIKDIELIYYTKGGSQTMIQGNIFQCRENDLMILEPYGVYQSKNEGQEGYEYLYIHFDIEPIALQNELIQMLIQGSPVKHCRDGRLLALFQHTLTEVKKHQIGSRALINILVKTICIEIIRNQNCTPFEIIHPTHRLTDQSVLVNEAIKYILNHISEDLSVKKLAEMFSISENYLYKSFIKVINQSPSQFIIQMRLEMAKSYLSSGVMTIQQITHDTEFSSQQHFARVFRQHEGMSPSQYQKKANTH